MYRSVLVSSLLIYSVIGQLVINLVEDQNEFKYVTKNSPAPSDEDTETEKIIFSSEEGDAVHIGCQLWNISTYEEKCISVKMIVSDLKTNRQKQFCEDDNCKDISFTSEGNETEVTFKFLKGNAIEWFAKAVKAATTTETPAITTEKPITTTTSEMTSGRTETTTHQADTTTEMEGTTTDLEEPTTVMAGTTTDMEESSTGMTESTTGMTESTTFMAETTTNLAESTTVMAGTTTDTAESTTVMAGTTTDMEESTTFMAETTTDLAESTTVMAGTTTDLAESTTLKAGTTTDLAESTTVMAGTTTDLAESTTGMTESTTGMTESTTFMAETTTDLAESTTVMAGTTTDLAESTTFMAGTTTDLAESTTVMAGTTTDLAESTTVMAGTTTDLAESTTLKAGTTTDLAESTTVMAGTTTDLAESTTGMTESTTGMTESTTFMAETTTDLAESTTVMAGTTTDLAESTTVMAGTTTDLAESTTVMAGTTTDLAESSTWMTDSTTGMTESTTEITETTTNLAEMTTQNIETTTAPTIDDDASMNYTERLIEPGKPITITTPYFPDPDSNELDMKYKFTAKRGYGILASCEDTYETKTNYEHPCKDFHIVFNDGERKKRLCSFCNLTETFFITNKNHLLFQMNYSKGGSNIIRCVFRTTEPRTEPSHILKVPKDSAINSTNREPFADDYYLIEGENGQPFNLDCDFEDTEKSYCILSRVVIKAKGTEEMFCVTKKYRISNVTTAALLVSSDGDGLPKIFCNMTVGSTSEEDPPLAFPYGKKSRRSFIQRDEIRKNWTLKAGETVEFGTKDFAKDKKNVIVLDITVPVGNKIYVFCDEYKPEYDGSLPCDPFSIIMEEEGKDPEYWCSKRRKESLGYLTDGNNLKLTMENFSNKNNVTCAVRSTELPEPVQVINLNKDNELKYITLSNEKEPYMVKRWLINHDYKDGNIIITCPQQILRSTSRRDGLTKHQYYCYERRIQVNNEVKCGVEDESNVYEIEVTGKADLVIMTDKDGLSGDYCVLERL